MTMLSGMTNRHSGLDLSAHAARLLISVVHVDSVKIQTEQHIWLLQLGRGSSPVQAAPASGAAAFRKTDVYLNYPQRVPQMTRWRRAS